jgi:hypothetical protein
MTAPIPCACGVHHLSMDVWRTLQFHMLDTWGEHVPPAMGDCLELARLPTPLRELVREHLRMDGERVA